MSKKPVEDSTYEIREGKVKKGGQGTKPTRPPPPPPPPKGEGGVASSVQIEVKCVVCGHELYIRYEEETTVVHVDPCRHCSTAAAKAGNRQSLEAFDHGREFTQREIAREKD